VPAADCRKVTRARRTFCSLQAESNLYGRKPLSSLRNND
jgi:hypothetical protein